MTYTHAVLFYLDPAAQPHMVDVFQSAAEAVESADRRAVASVSRAGSSFYAVELTVLASFLVGRKGEDRR